MSADIAGRSNQVNKAAVITPTIRPFLWGSVAIGLVVVGQFRLRDGLLFDALLFSTIGALIFSAVFRKRKLWLPEPAEPRPAAGAQALSHPLHWLGLFFAGVAVVATLIALRGFHADEIPELRTWVFHIAAVGLFLVAAFCADFGRDVVWCRANSKLRSDSSSPRGWSLPLIMLLGLFLRLYQFSDLPFGTWYDEAENGIQALRVLENADYWPVYVSSTHAPAHYIYLIAAAFRLFDVSTLSIRLVSVLMGMGTIAAGYLVGRELFGYRGGLILAFMLAVSRWDINLSRIGMYNISTPLFALLTFGLMMRGIRTRRIRDWTLAGLSLGLGLCFYSAFQLFVGVVVIYLLHLLIVRRGFLRRYRLGVAAMIVMSTLVFAPVLIYAYDNPDDYFDRARDTSLFADKEAERAASGIDN